MSGSRQLILAVLNEIEIKAKCLSLYKTEINFTLPVLCLHEFQAQLLLFLMGGPVNVSENSKDQFV